MADELLATKARRYYLVQQDLFKAEAEHNRLDAAVECVRVQQEEAALALQEAKAALAAEEDLRAVLTESVPAYVLKEDVPTYVAKKAAMMTRILKLHAMINDYETVLRANKDAFAAEESVMATLEAARAAEASHGTAMMQSIDRLTTQIARNVALIESSTAEKEGLEGRLKTSKAKEAAALKVLAARRAELRRAKEAVVAAGEATMAQRSTTAQAHKRSLHDASHAEEQEAWLVHLKKEQVRLRGMLAAYGERPPPLPTCTNTAEGGGGGADAVVPIDIPPMTVRPSDAVFIGHKALSIPLMDQFRQLNRRLLGEVANTVHGLEETYAETH